MIHGHKIKIKSLRQDLRSVSDELYKVIGELQKGKKHLKFQKWKELTEEKEYLLRSKKRIEGRIRHHKNRIRKIKDSKTKKK